MQLHASARSIKRYSEPMKEKRNLLHILRRMNGRKREKYEQYLCKLYTNTRNPKKNEVTRAKTNQLANSVIPFIQRLLNKHALEMKQNVNKFVCLKLFCN